MAASYDIFQ